MGRPRLPINADQVEDLASLGLNQHEIAARLGCAQSVISDRFRSEYALGVADLKASVRRRLVAAMNDGNVAAMIHLDKRLFGPLAVEDERGASVEEEVIAADEHYRRNHADTEGSGGMSE